MKKNLLLLAIVVLLAIIPLFIQKGAEFGGADGEAEANLLVKSMRNMNHGLKVYGSHQVVKSKAYYSCYRQI